jgi:biotin synthase-related radical SAM superfamily protein
MTRQEGPRGKTFIRVDWPIYPLEEVIGRAREKDQIHRVCISMITHPKALDDTLLSFRDSNKKQTCLSAFSLARP